MTTKPVPVPNHKLGKAMLHMLEMGKHPCFRIEGIRITIASAASVNPGSLYIKDDRWNYIGKITPYGLMKIQNPSLITDIQKTYILAAIHEPEKMAMSSGKRTGTCCCCGRTLTNSLSIELGIGPICRGFWFPPANVDKSPVDTVAMLETLDAMKELDSITDSLELDLGEPATQPKASVTSRQVCFKHPSLGVEGCPDCIQEAVDLLASLKVPKVDPVTEIAILYRALNDAQRMTCLNMLEGIESNGNK